MKQLFLLLLACAVGRAELAPEIAPIDAKYNAEIAAIDADRTAAIGRVIQAYQFALDGAEKTASATGDVKALTAIAGERDALKSGNTSSASPSSDLPKSLLPAQKTYAAGVARVDTEIKPRRERAVANYLRALGSLQTRVAGNAELVAQIAAQKESILRGMPVDVLEITKRLTGTTWDWFRGAETVTFQSGGKARWSVGGKEFSWKVTDPAARKIEGTNGKGNPFTLVLEQSLDVGRLVEKGGTARGIRMLPAKGK